MNINREGNPYSDGPSPTPEPRRGRDDTATLTPSRPWPLLRPRLAWNTSTGIDDASAAPFAYLVTMHHTSLASPGDRLLVPVDPFDLLAKALIPPWTEPVASSCPCASSTAVPFFESAMVGDDVGSSSTLDSTFTSASASASHHVHRCLRPTPTLELDADTTAATTAATTASTASSASPPPPPPCRVHIHRFTLFPASPLKRAALANALTDLALSREARDRAHQPEDASSNVGGYHSDRDLWSWPGVAALGLHDVLAAAVNRCAAYDAAARGDGEREGERGGEREGERGDAGEDKGEGEGRGGGGQPPPPPLAMIESEAWANVSRGSNWNTLHTHPGATYSGVLYVSDGSSQATRSATGGGATDSDASDGAPNETSDGAPDSAGYQDQGTQGIGAITGGATDIEAASTATGRAPGRAAAPGLLGGRLVLLPGAPASVSEENQAAHIMPLSPDDVAAAAAAGDMDMVFVQLDPVPGTVVIFPSFMPHFVTPKDQGEGRGGGGSECKDGEGGEEREESSLPSMPRISIAFNFTA